MDGQRRTVDPGWVVTVRRGGRRVVPLVDLWVASLLPGDLVDMAFAIVAEDATGAAVLSPPLEGACLPRAFIDWSSHRLWWDGPRSGIPHGLAVRSVVMRRPPLAGRQRQA